jgi:hypothetical protein
LQVPPRRGVVVAHPVLVEAGFALEPLAGEAVGGEGAGGDMHAAKGLVGGGPDLRSGGVGREDGAIDVGGADEGDHSAFDDGDRVPAVPDIFADQRSGGFVVLGDAAAVRIGDGVDDDRGRRGEGADCLGRVVSHGGTGVRRKVLQGAM